MMARLVFSSDAGADIDEIAFFSIRTFGPEVAADYLTGLEIACERLREFPELAAVYPRLRPAVRCLIYRSHRIFYRVNEDSVLILRILHHRRDAKRADFTPRG
jgi:toxin ParE1/3/4